MVPVFPHPGSRGREGVSVWRYGSNIFNYLNPRIHILKGKLRRENKTIGKLVNLLFSVKIFNVERKQQMHSIEP